MFKPTQKQIIISALCIFISGLIIVHVRASNAEYEAKMRTACIARAEALMQTMTSQDGSNQDAAIALAAHQGAQEYCLHMYK